MEFTFEDVVFLRQTALTAGKKIMEIYAQEDVGVEAKADDSPVTLADLAANQVIVTDIAARFPNEALVTEEEAKSHDIKADNFFIIDPLDGTKEFIHKRGDFTVNIAYITNGIPVFGIVYAPAKNRMFYTLSGKAYEDAGEASASDLSDGSTIHVREADNAALRVVASKSHRDAKTDEYINQYNVADFVSAGSSLKFCLVATGEADLYPRLGPTMEWDTAAGHAVASAAGAQVLDFDTKSPLTYGKPEYRNGFFIVTAPNVSLL